MCEPFSLSKMKRPTDDEEEGDAKVNRLDDPEYFLLCNDYPSTDQIIVQYRDEVRVVFWSEHEDYPQVWYHGRVIQTKDDNLVNDARDQLSNADINGTILSYEYKRVLELREMYNDNPFLSSITSESINTEIDDILEGCDMIAVTFDEHTRVELHADGPRFLTKYGLCDSRYGKCNSDIIIKFAWEMFRDPYTDWINGLAQCIMPLYDEIAIKCALQLKNNILENYAKPSVKIVYNSNVYVDLSPHYRILFFRCKRVHDFDVLLNKSIELLPSMPRERVITFEKLEGVLSELVLQLESLYLSTGEYKITDNKYEVLGYFTSDYEYSFQNPFLTVHFTNWQHRKDFERHNKENIALVYKDLVYNGTIVPAPRRNESLRVYFTEFKRYYYFFIQERGQKLTIRIGGVPDHMRYVISAYIQNNDITITSFFVHDKVKCDAIKSVNFRGTGPRGMLLIKYIAQRLGATDAYLQDVWSTGRGDKKMDSTNLKTVLSKRMDMDELSKEHEWFEEHREKIENWKKIYEEKGTLDMAIEHGYYGGYGFENQQDNMHAKVDSIECAAYMSGE